MKISVALCTFNGERFLHEQLMNILQQTVQVDEIIICDDGSLDGTVDIIKTFVSTHVLIRFYCNDETLGVVKNFEKAIKLCTGDIIFLSDQDDIWQQNKVEITLNYFNSNAGKSAVFSNADLIDEQGSKLGRTLWSSILFSPGAEASFNLFRYLCEYRNVITGACLAFKKEALQSILPFCTYPNLLHDEWIGLKLAQQDKLGYIDEPLVQYRLHPLQQTKNMWHKTDVTKTNFISLQRDAVEVDPLYHYRHWKKRTQYINKLEDIGITVSDELANGIKMKRKKALMELVKQKKMIPRKWQLLKYFIKQQEDISAADLIKS